MGRIITNPPHELKAKWGPLAHVSDEERQRILGLPAGRFKPEVERIERELRDLKKKQKGRL